MSRGSQRQYDELLTAANREALTELVEWKRYVYYTSYKELVCHVCGDVAENVDPENAHWLVCEKHKKQRYPYQRILSEDEYLFYNLYNEKLKAIEKKAPDTKYLISLFSDLYSDFSVRFCNVCGTNLDYFRDVKYPGYQYDYWHTCPADSYQRRCLLPVLDMNPFFDKLLQEINKLMPGK